MGLSRRHSYEIPFIDNLPVNSRLSKGADMDNKNSQTDSALAQNERNNGIRGKKRTKPNALQDVSKTASEIGGKIGHAAENASITLGKAADGTGKTLGRASRAASGAIEKASNRAGKGAQQIVSTAGKALGGAKETLSNISENPPIKIEDVITNAARVPGVRIDRESYLMGALTIWGTKEQAQRAVDTTPAEAGFDAELINRLADEAIAYENNLATAASVAAGLPSNAAFMIPATIADLSQFYAHVLRIGQKLGYLYGWNDLFNLEGDVMDDATRNVMVLFVGVMFGVKSAETALMSVAKSAGQVTAKRLARKSLTQGAIYPIVKKVAYYLGIKMNKQIFSSAVGKVIPLAGGVISGAVTRVSFLPMAKRLKNYLMSTPLAQASNEVEADYEIIDETDDNEPDGKQ